MPRLTKPSTNGTPEEGDAPIKTSKKIITKEGTTGKVAAAKEATVKKAAIKKAAPILGSQMLESSIVKKPSKKSIIPVLIASKSTMPSPKYEETNFVDSTKLVWNYSLFGDQDVQNFQNGTMYNGYQFFGAHQIKVLGQEGYYFAVWAPNATSLSVVGHFNGWKPHEHELMPRLEKSGIWEGFIPGITKGGAYKYHIVGYEGKEMDKGDPYAIYWEHKPQTASIAWHQNYYWHDESWMIGRKKNNALDAPWTIYEVHLHSWMRPDKNNEDVYNSYPEIAKRLVPYVKEMGFTHVELMPVMEHPFDGSWGYQGTGYFAPTSRFGTPEEFKAMVDAFHQAGIGVVLDWVPSHFPYDSHGLYMFDGTHTYEYADMRKGFHPDWNSYIFNYRRNEVKGFLISNARYWFDQFHVDGIRVDAVSSILKLDYSRKEGEWEPNEFGGNGNIEAIAFIKEMNEMVYRDFPDVQTIAEESTDWPGVSKPTFLGGLGFGMKWMMGWMHDTIDYFKLDPIARKNAQDKFAFSMMYFYDENFMLPFSHDEVVHGKSPMLHKMPGDEWQKFANMRLMYSYMFTHPGGKLLFMGNEFGATQEWNHHTELQWGLLQYEPHSKLKKCVSVLLHIAKGEPSLYEKQFKQGGFEWVEMNMRNECIVAYRRKGMAIEDDILIVLNMTSVVRNNVPIYTDGKKVWKEIFNSDDKEFYGTGDTFNPKVPVELVDEEKNLYKLTLQLPPLGAVIFK